MSHVTGSLPTGDVIFQMGMSVGEWSESVWEILCDESIISELQ
jgi:hypothetical protein